MKTLITGTYPRMILGDRELQWGVVDDIQDDLFDFFTIIQDFAHRGPLIRSAHPIVLLKIDDEIITTFLTR